jgi:hypothetical protein
LLEFAVFRLISKITNDVPTPAPDAKASRKSLATLFFCTAMPMGMWSVPLANVFNTHGRGHLVPWVFCPRRPLRAFISPLFVGALADQKALAGAAAALADGGDEHRPADDLRLSGVGGGVM